VSSPGSPEISFAFKVSGTSSAFKKTLVMLAPGTPLRFSHVAGDFTLPPDTGQPLLFIAGGIGITPFHSMVNSLTTRRDIVLLYAVADLEDIAFKDDLDRAARLGVRTEYIQGRLTPEVLQRAVPDLSKRQVYISGPDAMVRCAQSMVRRLGVPRHLIRADHFSGY
jgi:ferredoxin-NADP reductase